MIIKSDPQEQIGIDLEMLNSSNNKEDDSKYYEIDNRICGDLSIRLQYLQEIA